VLRTLGAFKTLILARRRPGVRIMLRYTEETAGRKTATLSVSQSSLWGMVVARDCPHATLNGIMRHG
jgi:hypothetical protein